MKHNMKMKQNMNANLYHFGASCSNRWDLENQLTINPTSRDIIHPNTLPYNSQTLPSALPTKTLFPFQNQSYNVPVKSTNPPFPCRIHASKTKGCEFSAEEGLSRRQNFQIIFFIEVGALVFFPR